MTTITKLAPYQSCVSCYKGDTTTVIAVKGTAEFHAAALVTLAGLPIQEAIGTVQAAALDLGHDIGGRYKGGFRLCRDCATKTGAKVTDLSDLNAGKGVVYVQREDDLP